MNHNSSTKWVAALAACSAVGAVAGLMFAPYSGRKLRRKVWHRAEDAFDHVSAKGSRFFRRCENVAGNVTHFVKRSA